MNTNKKEDLLKEYDSYEGFGLAVYILAAISLIVVGLGVAGIYALVSYFVNI